ncbi:hypothetical protein D3C87_1734530 [compost metagenome]
MGAVAARSIQHAAADFITCRQRAEQIAATNRSIAGGQCRQQRGQDDGARMVAAAGVVEFEDVGRNAVDQRRVPGAGALWRCQ